VKYANDEKLSLKREVLITCKKCGKKTKRVLTNFQTINPWNVKPRVIIYKEIDMILDEMEARLKKKGLVCNKCQ
jgi:hypothetical protein